jgi:hypothetical protein
VPGMDPSTRHRPLSIASRGATCQELVAAAATAPSGLRNPPTDRSGSTTAIDAAAIPMANATTGRPMSVSEKFTV